MNKQNLYTIIKRDLVWVFQLIVMTLKMVTRFIADPEIEGEGWMTAEDAIGDICFEHNGDVKYDAADRFDAYMPWSDSIYREFGKFGIDPNEWDTMFNLYWSRLNYWKDYFKTHLNFIPKLTPLFGFMPIEKAPLIIARDGFDWRGAKKHGEHAIAVYEEYKCSLHRREQHCMHFNIATFLESLRTKNTEMREYLTLFTFCEKNRTLEETLAVIDPLWCHLICGIPNKAAAINILKAEEYYYDRYLSVAKEFSFTTWTAVDNYIRKEEERRRLRDDIYALNLKYGINLGECRMDLPRTQVTLGGYTAGILPPWSRRQVELGYQSCCCQHVNGAGETAMVYGLAMPRAGFWVVVKGNDLEKDDLVAQAEIWEDINGRLIFDNIETANGRPLSKVDTIVDLWSEADPHESILLGLGYAKVGEGRWPYCPAPEQPPLTLQGRAIHVYTDANEDNGCALIKRNGTVQTTVSDTPCRSWDGWDGF